MDNNMTIYGKKATPDDVAFVVIGEESGFESSKDDIVR
jgi:hypothetical protein